MADNKMPPKDKKELDRIRKLFEEGLNAASKDPDKLDEIRRKKDQMIKPWEDYMKGWSAPKDKKTEKKDKKAGYDYDRSED